MPSPLHFKFNGTRTEYHFNMKVFYTFISLKYMPNFHTLCKFILGKISTIHFSHSHESPIVMYVPAVGGHFQRSPEENF